MQSDLLVPPRLDASALTGVAGVLAPTSWILQGAFGRATVSIITRALVAHAHAQFNVLIKLGGEDVKFRAGDAEFALTDDTVILFNPWESHAKLENERNPSVHLVLEIEQDWAAAVLSTEIPLIQKLFPRPWVAATPEIRELAHRVAAAISHSLTTTDAGCNAIIAKLLIELVQNHGTFGAAHNAQAAGPPIDRRIRRALEHISARAAENPNLDEIASGVGLSRSHFFQQFKRCVGVSPQHYLDWQRMKLAIRELSVTDRPIAEIALDLGFSAPSHFTRFFIQHMSVSPSEFRRFNVNLAGGAPDPAYETPSGPVSGP